MPYFVFHITTNPETNTKELEHLETFTDYKTARNFAREGRAALPAGSVNQDVRLIFAKNQVEAEKLMSAPRDERVVGED